MIDPIIIASTSSQSNQQSGNNVEKSSSEETKPKVTLEERVSRGEAQTGPTIPIHQAQRSDNEPSPSIRQVYPPVNAQLQKEQTNQSQEPQLSSSTIDDGKKKKEETTSTTVSSSQQDETQQKQEITKEEEKKIVDAVLKELTPFVEQLVATEVRRVLSGETGHDGTGMIQFPFIFASGGPILTSSYGSSPSQSFQQQQGTNLGGVFSGSLRGNVEDEIPNYASNAHPYGSYSHPPGKLIVFF